MPSGGRRPNSGRPPGSRNKISKATRQAIASAETEAGRRSVVQFLIDTVHDETQPMRVRLESAKTVIGYLVPRLSSSEVGGPDGGPLVFNISVDDSNL